MEQITLEQLIHFITMVAGVITGGGIIYGFWSNQMKEKVAEQLEPINNKLDKINDLLTTVQYDNCKNYIVEYLAKYDCVGNNCPVITTEETQRFWENYRTYEDLGGNSYVHNKVEKLKSDGKL